MKFAIALTAGLALTACDTTIGKSVGNVALGGLAVVAASPDDPAAALAAALPNLICVEATTLATRAAEGNGFILGENHVNGLNAMCLKGANAAADRVQVASVVYADPALGVACNKLNDTGRDIASREVRRAAGC